MTHSHSFDAAPLFVQCVDHFATDVKSNKWKLFVEKYRDRERKIESGRERVGNENAIEIQFIGMSEERVKHCRYLFVNGFPGVKSFNLVLRINLFGKFTVRCACGKICKSRCVNNKTAERDRDSDR